MLSIMQEQLQENAAITMSEARVNLVNIQMTLRIATRIVKEMDVI